MEQRKWSKVIVAPQPFLTFIPWDIILGTHEFQLKRTKNSRLLIGQQATYADVNMGL